MKLKITAAGIFFASLFVSCEVFDPGEQIPSYIYIDTIKLTTTYLTQGSASGKFTDAWIYVDDQSLGVYELPATIPALQKGNHEVKVRGGIKVNGIAASRSAYPVCDFYSQYVNLDPGKTVSIDPEVSYFPAVTFKWKEDFESVGVSLTTTSLSDTSLQIISDTAGVFEGRFSGAAYLDSNNPFFECASSASFSLPLDNVYLEMNYKCNNSFSVGVYAAGNGSPFTTLFVNPSAEWNKIYINLANEIGTAHSNPYTVFIRMAKNEGVALPELYIDNIKLIHQ